MTDQLFLATTALDAFWDQSKPILFLGEWCKPYKNKHQWENLNYTVLADPLIDEDPNAVLAYVEKIYHALLPQLSQWLNTIHRTQHPVSYWEIVMGSFLFTYIQTVYDRYARLKVAFERYPQLETIGLSEHSFCVPLNTGEFYIWAMMQDGLNLQICSQLISLAFHQPKINRNYDWHAEKKEREASIDQCRPRLRTKLQLYLMWFIIRCFGKKTVAVTAAHGFSKKSIYKLMMQSFFRILPTPARSQAQKERTALLKTNPDFALRSGLLALNTNDTFESILLKMLIFHMPLSFIENYKLECRISKKQYPYFSKVVFGAPPIGSESLKLWIAKNKSRDVKQVGWQHGGGYGSLLFDSIEYVEHKFSDYFVAWGMENKNKVIAAPAVSICLQLEEKKELSRIEQKKNKSILWVATEFTRYPFVEIKHCIGANRFEKSYYDWQVKVLSQLHPEIFSQIMMRLRYTDWSDNWKCLEEALPTLQLHKPTDRSSFYSQIRSAKLLIFDNFNTTYLYGLTQNIPSILFWDQDIWTLRDSAKPHFAPLEEVGIYHTTQTSAINMINAVGNDPADWWYSEAVQKARKHYCDYFTRASEDWLQQWKKMLLNLRVLP